MKIRRATVRRFIYFVLRIEPPQFCVHQTLTFSPAVFDAPVARKKIKRLLDNLHKRFEMASFHILEEHKSGAWHFHVLFLFFPENPLPCAPSRIDIDFRRIILTAWSRLQDGTLNSTANATNVVERIELGYLLKNVEIAKPGEALPRSPVRWWQPWNLKLFARHKQPIDKAEAKKAFTDCKTTPAAKPSLQPPPNKPYGPAELRREKRDINAWWEVRGKGPNFEEYKRRETGRDKKVSDSDFILFRNGRAPWEEKVKDGDEPDDDSDLPF